MLRAEGGEPARFTLSASAHVHILASSAWTWSVRRHERRLTEPKMKYLCVHLKFCMRSAYVFSLRNSGYKFGARQESATRATDSVSRRQSFFISLLVHPQPLILYLVPYLPLAFNERTSRHTEMLRTGRESPVCNLDVNDYSTLLSAGHIVRGLFCANVSRTGGPIH